MMPAFAGLAIGAASEVPVLMAGGTQMSAVLAIIKALRPEIMQNLAIATTRWVVNDRHSDIVGLVRQVHDVPILAADLDFSFSAYEGLRAYEQGVVKEGVGAGGATVAAMVKTRGKITKERLLAEIEKNYRALVEQR
jgi:NaMN:DMB phosphoribosyltransferase